MSISGTCVLGICEASVAATNHVQIHMCPYYDSAMEYWESEGGPGERYLSEKLIDLDITWEALDEARRIAIQEEGKDKYWGFLVQRELRRTGLASIPWEYRDVEFKEGEGGILPHGMWHRGGRHMSKKSNVRLHTYVNGEQWSVGFVL